MWVDDMLEIAITSLRAIAEYPAPEQVDMPAANMRLLAKQALQTISRAASERSDRAL